MHLDEKTLDSKEIYKGTVVHLFNDTVLLENGRKAGRDVIKHPGGVCVVALTDENEVLMVKQFRYPHHRVTTEIPAGKLEWSESHLECGKRELLEETGFVSDSFDYLGCLLPTPAYDTEIIHMYLARGLHYEKQKLDEGEFLDVERIPLDKAVEMIMNNQLQDAKTQIAIMKTKLLLTEQK